MKDNGYILSVLIKILEAASSHNTNIFNDQCSIILKLVNAERAKTGIPLLRANASLNKLAEMKSQDIVEKNYFSHQSPTYGSPFDMMKAYGIRYTYAGENLAIDRYPAHAYSAWMTSTAHRDNILNPNFTETGIGIYTKGSSTYVYTQLFMCL